MSETRHMTESMKPSNEVAIAMDAETLRKCLNRMAMAIVNDHDDVSNIALLGILSRGRPLAERLAAEIGAITKIAPKVGSLATTLYRDDLRSGLIPAKVGSRETHFDFNVDGMTVILVDDVMSTGRTARAALDEIMDYGRPKRIRLACLVDRGHRELPIQPDYCGWAIATHPDDHVAVHLKESDGEDAVLVERVSDGGAEK